MTPVPASVGASYYGAVPVQASNQLNLSTFINLLTAQLSQQDPTQPMTSDEMASQITSLGQMQGMQQLTQNAQQQQAQQMIGETVTAPRPNGSSENPTVTGPVVNASLVSGNYQVGIQDTDGSIITVNASAVSAIQPGTNITQAANLIGATVSGNIPAQNGSTAPQAVSGSVSGVSVVNGQVVLNVLTSSGATVQMPESGLTQISN